MKSHDSPSAEWMDARVEAYVDGELPRTERVRFEAALDADAAWAREVHCAQEIQNELHALPQPTCPPQVTRAVVAHVQQDRARTASPPTWAEWWARAKRELDIEFHLGWRPALISTALIALVALSVVVTAPPKTPVTHAQMYSAAEIARAEAQAEWTFAYIASLGRRTESALRRDVIEPRLERPVRRALQPIAPDATQSSSGRLGTEGSLPRTPLKDTSQSPDRKP